MKKLVLAILLASGLALASGRAGYRIDVGPTFSIRVWAEEVLWQAAGFEQVAGVETWYNNGIGLYAYTGWAYVTNSFWVQVQMGRGTDGSHLALIGGWSW